MDNVLKKRQINFDLYSFLILKAKKSIPYVFICYFFFIKKYMYIKQCHTKKVHVPFTTEPDILAEWKMFFFICPPKLISLYTLW